MCEQNKDKCTGCGHTFASYGMTKSEAYHANGKHYCNSDCELESVFKNIEREEMQEISAEY